jgi:hypothetical protein
MQQVATNSRLISSVAYDPETHVLHVWMRNRRHFRHADITPAVYQNLISSESVGFYYTCYIAQSKEQGRRFSFRFLIKIVVACVITMFIVSLSATAISA